MTSGSPPNAARPRGLFARLSVLEPAPPWGWGAAASAVIVAVVAVIGISVITLAVLGVQSYTVYLGWMIAVVIMAYWVVSTRSDPEDRAAMRLELPTIPLPFLMFIMIGFVLVIDLLGLAVTGLFLPFMELFTFNITNATALEWIFAVGFMVFTQPVGEEMIFRGVLFPLMRARLGAVGGLVANAAAYALFHLVLYTSQIGAVDPRALIWYGLIAPFLDGLILACVRAYTQSTSAAIVAHVVFGLFAIVKLFVITG